MRQFIVGAWRTLIGVVGAVLFIMGVLVDVAKEEGVEWQEAKELKRKLKAAKRGKEQ